MKSLRINLATITLALMLVSPCFAGGGSDGGANSVNYKIVEEYNTDISDLKGYELFKQKVEMLKKELPGFGKLVEERAEKMHWYVLPKTVTTLPKEKTGLYFETEQMAFQTEKEIFIDEVAAGKMSEIGGAKLLMHEAVMSALKDKPSTGVRMVVNRIFAKNFSVRNLEGDLAKARLGFYFSPEQLEKMRKKRTELYYELLSRITDKAGDACVAGKPMAEIHTALGDIGLMNNRNWGNIRSPFVNVRGRENWTGNIGLLARGNAFDLNVVDMYLVAHACGDSDKANPACDALHAWYMGFAEFRAFSANFSAFNDVESHSIGEINKNKYNMQSKDMFQVFQKLLKNPEFVNILALNSPPAPEGYEDIEHSPKWPTYIRKILSQVSNRRDALASLNEGSKRKLLCESIESVDQMLRKEAGIKDDTSPDEEVDEDEKPAVKSPAAVNKAD